MQSAVRILILVVIIIVLWWLLFAEKDNRLKLGVDDNINVTPEQIQSIRNIGEWEFLSISDEELVDTVRKGLFRNDELVRIYYGTLRLGIDMKQARLTPQGDSILVTLPKVGLLDRDFIDEARTKSFFESGSWKAEDREALYKRAYQKMKVHCLTPTNLRTAEDNARESFRKLLRSMGYPKTVINFAK